MKKLLVVFMLCTLMVFVVGCGEAETDSSATENSEVQTTESLNISPEFKDAMDDMELFIDEYVAFMAKYAESDDVTSMLNDFNDYMTKYTEVMAELEAIEDDDLTADELEYYTEVMTRINEKLSEVKISGI